MSCDKDIVMAELVILKCVLAATLLWIILVSLMYKFVFYEIEENFAYRN